MIKKIIFIVLVALVLGLYFYPDDTKDIVDATAHAIKEKANDFIERDDVQNKISDVKENISEEIKQKKDEAIDKAVEDIKDD